MFDNEGEYRTWGKSEKKGKSHDGYVTINELCKHFLHSMCELMFTSKDIPISIMEEIVTE